MWFSWRILYLFGYLNEWPQSSDLSHLGWSYIKVQSIIQRPRKCFKVLASAVEKENLEIWPWAPLPICSPIVYAESFCSWTDCAWQPEFTCMSACQLLSAWYRLNLAWSWRGQCTSCLQLYKKMSEELRARVGKNNHLMFTRIWEPLGFF